MRCQSERSLILGFERCDRRAVYEVRGSHSTARLCATCRLRHARIVDERFPGSRWDVVRLDRLKLMALAWVVLSFSLGVALGGCGTVDQAAQLDASGAAGAAGGAGANPTSSGGGGAAGAAGGVAGNNPRPGGAAGGGQGGAIPLVDAGGGTAGTGDDGGASWPTCPKVGSLVIAWGGHCYACDGETDAGVVGGGISRTCQISAMDSKGLGLGQGPDFCAAKSAACP